MSLSPGQDPKNSGCRVDYICENILPNLAICFPVCHSGFKLSFVGLSVVSLVCLPLAVNHSGGALLFFILPRGSLDSPSLANTQSELYKAAL